MLSVGPNEGFNKYRFIVKELLPLDLLSYVSENLHFVVKHPICEIITKKKCKRITLQLMFID